MAMDRDIKREVVENFFKMADINGDGQITYEEFYQMFKMTIQNFN